MPLSATNEAIGAVSEAIRAQLQLRTGMLVTVDRPDQAASRDDESKLNLFLYQTDFDPYLKNVPLDEGMPPPLWLSLRYLITAYDQNHDSDTVDAHRLLARGMAALQEINILWPTVPSLVDNPEPLKLTFDPCDVDLLSKIMQGTDEKYRLSAAFQVRPVLIAPDVPPAFALPVLTVGPPGAEGVTVLPSMGPRLLGVTPPRFEAGATIELYGEEIGSQIETAYIGPLALPVIAARTGAVQVRVPADTTLSAGVYPAVVARRLPSGRTQTSNPQFVTLMPTVTTATHGALVAAGGGRFSGTATLNGVRLGGPDDVVFVAFYRDGAVVLNLEVTGTAAQTSLSAVVDNAHALLAGDYYLIVRVNGAQAAHAPMLGWQP